MENEFFEKKDFQFAAVVEFKIEKAYNVSIALLFIWTIGLTILPSSRKSFKFNVWNKFAPKTK